MCAGGALCGFEFWIGGLSSLLEHDLSGMCRAVALA
jgi:hypothetical protein